MSVASDHRYHSVDKSSTPAGVTEEFSEWVKDAHRVRTFAWQEGYGAFSVSKSGVPKTREYIREQAKHHRRRTFQQEYLEFLEKNGIEYDEQYLW